MYHYVYLIENLVNGKIYVGKHSTDDLEDGYMGSGKLISRASAKHGVENFRKHIIQYHESEKEALDHEHTLVNEEFVRDPNTYNLTLGGKGGWSGINFDVEARQRKNQRAMRIALEKMWADPEYRKRRDEARTPHNKNLNLSGRRKVPDWTGKKHKQESKDKIGAANSVHQLGEKNSNFGKVWVHHLDLCTSKCILKSELEPYTREGWKLGRKMKW